jgi:hypothetical protein
MEEHVLQISDSNREEWRRHVAGETGAECPGGGDRTPNVNLEFGVEQWREEGKPLDVVHVEVAEQDVDAIGCAARVHGP